MARPERVELPTFWFVARRSIQLSYGRTRRCGLPGGTAEKLYHSRNFASLAAKGPMEAIPAAENAERASGAGAHRW